MKSNSNKLCAGDAGSGPHLHFEQYNGQREKIRATPPEAGFTFMEIYDRDPKNEKKEKVK